MTRPRARDAALRCAALGALLLGWGCERASELPLAKDSLAASTAEPAVNAAEPAPASKAAAPVLTPEGYGPLRIGMSLADVVTAYGTDSDPGAVGGPEAELCDQFRPVRAPEGLLVMVEEGRLTRITATSGSEVETDKGLSVGATAAEVRAAYGARVGAEPFTEFSTESPELREG